jgi:ribonucleoside-diphosphate reductase alpha chain
MGIYTADERQRQLETGSYEAPVEETVDQGSVEVEDTAVVEEANEARRVETAAKPAPQGAHTTAELLESLGTAVDSPLCFTCGTKMRPAGSCFVCEGCGSTSGCS